MKGNVYKFRSDAPLGLVIGKCKFGLLVQWLDVHLHGKHDQTFIFLKGKEGSYQVHPGAIQFVSPTEFLGKEPVDTIYPELLASWLCDKQLQESGQRICAEASRR